jgi:NAD(P)-dependent dehydrogenase (short-subunit alcohol dehydrogenase family)
MTNAPVKSAIITGASGGIGCSVAKKLATDGFAVVVNYAGKVAPAQAVVAELKAAGGQAILASPMWLCTAPESCPCFRSLQAMWKLSTK